jgi:hypothetical protein
METTLEKHEQRGTPMIYFSIFVAVEWLAFLLYIHEIRCENLETEAGYPPQVLFVVLLSPSQLIILPFDTI